MIRLRTIRTNSSDNWNFCKSMYHNSTTTTHYSYRYGSNNFTTHFLIPEGYNCATTTLDLPLERSYFSQACIPDFCIHKQIFSPKTKRKMERELPELVLHTSIISTTTVIGNNTKHEIDYKLASKPASSKKAKCSQYDDPQTKMTFL